MTVGQSKAKIYAEKNTKVTFADVAGVDEAKDELREVIEFLKTPEKFTRLGGKIPKGILLVLATQKVALLEGAKRLLDQEVISGSDLKAIMDQYY